MQSNADAAIRATLKHEGGFADHPKDPGGATNKGITLATFRRLVKPDGTVADLKKLTTDQAIVAYRKGFWATVMGDQLPAGVDFAVFDYGVNSGTARAVKALQELVGANVDGVVGPKTLAAVKATDEADLIMELCAQRLAFVKRLKTWPTFGRGWESRIAGVRKLALEMVSAQPSVVPDEPTQPEPETPATDAPAAFQPDWRKIIGWALALAILAIVAFNLLT